MNVPELVLGDCEGVWLGREATQAAVEQVLGHSGEELIMAGLQLAPGA